VTHISKQFRESESPTPKNDIKYFDEEWPKEEAILAIGLKQSKLHKAERQQKESKSLNITQTNVKGNRK
jgi:hypothetical protein